MQINRIDSLQFRSKINVVNPKYYESITKTMANDPAYHNIFEWFIRTGLRKNNKLNAFRTNVSQLSTEEIRSCTAGFFVNALEKVVKLGFHIYDGPKNMKKLGVLNNLLEGTNGLLVGCRSRYPLSAPIFENFEKKAAEKNIPLTVMKDFKGMWEANVAYDAVGDEFYLCVKDIQNPKKFVSNMDELRNAFEKFELSPKDTIEFL